MAITLQNALSPSLLQAGLQGVQNGMARAGNAAAEIASQTADNAAPDGASLATSLVELKLSEVQVAASAKVVKSADELVGTLIDTLA